MIHLPVSVGEALDKLSILDIKLQKIQDVNKRSHCQREYDVLMKDVEPYVNANAFYYKLLRSTNLQIWEMQDDIRERPNPQKCVDILDKNDMRFRIKDVINQNAKSYIREQKGYPTRSALVIGHLGLGDHIGLNGAVRYIALQHDETVVVCYRHNAKNVAAMFADNPSIKLWEVEHGYIIHPTSTNAGEVVVVDPIRFTSVYRCGFYTFPLKHSFEDLPSCFYRDMGIDPVVRHTHFYVPTTDEAVVLYEQVRNQPYVFVQQMSSSHITNLLSWNIHDILTIDPNQNLYPEDHPWHTLAQSFVNRDFLSYVLVIQHAKEIHTVDSSFYCLSSYLPLDAEVKRCYSRETGTFIPSYTFN